MGRQSPSGPTGGEPAPRGRLQTCHLSVQPDYLSLTNKEASIYPSHGVPIAPTASIDEETEPLGMERELGPPECVPPGGLPRRIEPVRVNDRVDFLERVDAPSG